MKSSYILLGLSFFAISSFLQAQNFPGGVPGVEIWYKATHDDLQNGEYIDFSENSKSIRSCYDVMPQEALFNFNPSIEADSLCLIYTGLLESATVHNLFIVSEPVDKDESYRHISTKFKDYVYTLLPPSYNNSISKNTYILETKQGYASSVVAKFNQHQLANVHFYGWSNYDSDKKFKSYGQEGETFFYIGEHFPFPKLQDGVKFNGLFPEYVSFDRHLTDNERNRVESYLALKYGITLAGDRSYKNSRNKVFWNKENNSLFGNNIFGIGRDDISGLNQLQCESVHNRDYLVAAIIEIDSTNATVQNNYEIANNDFLVFGDTGEGGLRDPNEQNLQLLEKVWLAQITGEEIREFPIHFRLALNNEFQPFLSEIDAGDLVVWMLHDRYVDNSYVSEFDNGNVDYYKPIDIEFAPGGEVYAHYRAEVVRFDEDHNFFDQYTFAIGPEIIIQVRYVQWQCEAECYEVEIVVIGGEPEYSVVLINGNGEDSGLELSYEEEGEGEEQAIKYIYVAEVCGNQEYTVIAEDQNGSYAEYSFYVEAQNHSLDLGPDQNLSAGQTNVLLDAGQGVNDPNATYVWYYNGEQIYHPGSTLDADQPGEYCVVMTTSDMSCQLEDCIGITNHFGCEINSGSGCNEGENFIDITVLGGIPPYITTISGNGLNFNHTHQGSTSITDIPYNLEDTYLVTVTDSLGATCVSEVTFQETGSWGSLGPNQMLSLAQQTIILDGTLPFGNNPDYTYQWSRNGSLLSSTAPQFTVTIPGTYQVTVTFPDGCKGKASIIIGYNLEGSVDQHSDCDEASNTLDIIINYGIPPYKITIAESPSGTVYYTQSNLVGSITQSGIPYGDYTVTVTDDYGGVIYQQVSFTGLQLDIADQLMTVCNSCIGGCSINNDYCGSGMPMLFLGSCSSPSSFLLDASSLIQGGQNITYDWSINGISLNYHDPMITFVNNNGICSPIYYDYPNYCDGLFITVTVTNSQTGCSISQTAVTVIGWCPVLNQPPARPSGPSLATKVYPNPSVPSAAFYYNVSSEETFDGMVEIYDMTGSLIRQRPISGKSDYTLSFNLLASGTYFICTKTRGTLTTDKVIIE